MLSLTTLCITGFCDIGRVCRAMVDFVFVLQDFVISAVFAVLWLISSSAWAQGVVNLKYYTDLKECGIFDMIADCSGNKCTQSQFPNFASLNVSIVSRGINAVLWFLICYVHSWGFLQN